MDYSKVCSIHFATSVVYVEYHVLQAFWHVLL